jgi:hypothetical protein
MRLYLALIVLTLLSSTSLLGQAQSAESIQAVDYCALVANPQQYDAQWVKTSGWISRGFENFTLYSDDCGGEWTSRHFEVWLGRTDQDSRIYPGKIPPIGFAIDENYRRMQNALEAGRFIDVNGERCRPDECPFYRIRITATGFFLARSGHTHPGQIGYGHIGCCHLLSMVRINDTVLKRTTLPLGGDYVCTSDSWVPSPGEIPVGEQCADVDACKANGWKRLTLLAQHWGDKVDLATGSLSLDSNWVSEDRTLRYARLYPKSKSDVPEKVTFQRQSCVPKNHASDSEEHGIIRCTLKLGPKLDGKDSVESMSPEGAALAFARASAERFGTALVGSQRVHCRSWEGTGIFADCTVSANGGLQEFALSMKTKKGGTHWALEESLMNVCSVVDE